MDLSDNFNVFTLLDAVDEPQLTGSVSIGERVDTLLNQFTQTPQNVVISPQKPTDNPTTFGEISPTTPLPNGGQVVKKVGISLGIVVVLLVILQLLGVTQSLSKVVAPFLPGKVKDFFEWLALQPSLFRKNKKTYLVSAEDFSSRIDRHSQSFYQYLTFNPNVIVNDIIVKVQNFSFGDDSIHIDVSTFGDLDLFAVSDDGSYYLAVDSSLDLNYYKIEVPSLKVQSILLSER